jgi:hypothetical protein
VAGRAAGAVPQSVPGRPRIACLASFWAAPNSHADWIITKLLDGYWWQGAHTPSRVDVASVYIHQHATSLLGQKICQAKNIPIYKTVGEAVTLGGTELAVDGVVIVGEHGDYPTDLKGHWLLPRWWIYQQVIKVFEKSGRSVPVFNDKHLSYNWDDAKWMFDKSRRAGFPLTGGSSIPILPGTGDRPAVDTPLKNAIVLGARRRRGPSSTVSTCFRLVERRRAAKQVSKPSSPSGGPRRGMGRARLGGRAAGFGGETFQLKPSRFARTTRRTPASWTTTMARRGRDLRPGRRAGRSPARSRAVGAGDHLDARLAGLSRSITANGQPHWITEMMVTKREPFNASGCCCLPGL